MKREQAPIDDVFRDIARTNANAVVLTPTEQLCRTDSCDVYLDGEFIYRDNAHFRRNLRLQTRRDLADKLGLTAALAPAS